MSADQQENKQSGGDHTQGDHSKIALFLKHAAHHDRTHESWCSSCKRKNEEGSISEFRDPCRVRYEVFGESGNQKQGKHDRKTFFAVQLFDKAGDFFFTKEQVHTVSAKKSGEIKSAGGSKRDPYNGKQIAKPEPIGIASGKLDELAGYHRYYDLRDLQSDINKYACRLVLLKKRIDALHRFELVKEVGRKEIDISQWSDNDRQQKDEFQNRAQAIHRIPFSLMVCNALSTPNLECS